MDIQVIIISLLCWVFFGGGGGDLQTFNVLINQQYKELDKTGSIDEVTYIVFLLVKNVLIQTIRS